MDGYIRFDFDKITQENSDKLVGGGFCWDTFFDDLDEEKANFGAEEEEGLEFQESLEERCEELYAFVCKIKEACSVTLTDDELKAIDDAVASRVGELKGVMESINEVNEERCQKAITAFVKEIREDAGGNVLDVRNAVEEALGVIILFKSDKDEESKKWNNVNALLKMELNTPDEKERGKMSEEYCKAFNLEENVSIQVNKDPVVVHSYDAGGWKHQMGEFDVGDKAIEAIKQKLNDNNIVASWKPQRNGKYVERFNWTRLRGDEKARFASHLRTCVRAFSF